MNDKIILNIENVIDYIERNLDSKLTLNDVAKRTCYSQYYFHRLFKEVAGMTLHDYINRRQLTRAAKFLVFSRKSVIDIALSCGYESQQAFTAAFREMYKKTPAKYREARVFYALQEKFFLHREMADRNFTVNDVQAARAEDIPCWMDLVKAVLGGYPYLNEADYLKNLKRSIAQKRALILKYGDSALGVMSFSYKNSHIEFFGIHPQYRNLHIGKVFLQKLSGKYLPGRDIGITTYRENDKADTGYRAALKQLGFAERELLTEYGYPTQRFVWQNEGGSEV